MEHTRYVAILWKWKWLIAIATLVAAVSAYQADRQTTPVYVTTTSVMVGQLLQSRNPQQQEFATSQLLAQGYALMVRQTPVLQATIDSLGFDMSTGELNGKLSATVLPGTALIQISVADGDPSRARIIADELARQIIRQSPTGEQDANRETLKQQLSALATRISTADDQLAALDQKLSAETTARGILDIQNQMAALQPKVDAWRTTYGTLLAADNGGLNHLDVVETAPLPTSPVNPNPRRDVLAAAVIGLVLAAATAFIIEYLDDTIRTSEDVERVTRLPTLGTITRLEKFATPAGYLVGLYNPLSRVAEAYRILCTNVRFSSLSTPAKRLLVTSSGPDEGKTITACNLAVAMAGAGKRVILVDADLRRPSVHRFFGVSNQVGLTSLLLDEDLPIESALVQTRVDGLTVLPSGPLPPNPAELLGSQPMIRRVNELDRAEVIIFDSRSVLGIADTTILGTLCSGVILVVDAQRTRSDHVRRAKANLDQVGLKILGAVLNKHADVAEGDFGSHAYRIPGFGRWRRAAAPLMSFLGITRF